MNAIASIDTHHLTGPGMPQLLVEVTDDEGNRGVGECWWGIVDSKHPENAALPIKSALDAVLTPRALGKNADDINRIWFDCWDHAYRYGDGGVITMALAGLDIALWDLKAKRLELSLVDLLGGPVKETIPAYASLPPLRKPELLRTETERAIAHGFMAIKLHELDPTATAIVREVAGPDVHIMVDVNGHFDVVEAIQIGYALSNHDVLWYEEPVRPMRDVKAIARVADALLTDIAAGENEYSLADFERLIASGAVTYVQPEITKIGGVTPALSVGALVDTHNLVLCPHNFRLGPSLMASIHWGFTNRATGWIEIPWVPSSMQFASGATVPELVNGCVPVPQAPGIGFSL